MQLTLPHLPQLRWILVSRDNTTYFTYTYGLKENDVINNALSCAHSPGQDFELVATALFWSSGILESCDDWPTSSQKTLHSDPWLLVAVGLLSQKLLLKFRALDAKKGRSVLGQLSSLFSPLDITVLELDQCLPNTFRKRTRARK